jgi:uncharacterized protein (DUF1697 family)
MARSIRYAALLRGVNVGAHNRLGMARLRAALDARGVQDVSTYLQSGNVLLTSAARPAAVVAELEDCLSGDLGIPARVVVRTAAELGTVVDDDPLADVADDPVKHFVAFLSKAPPKAKVRELLALDVAPERLAFGRREAYLWCPDGLRASRLARVSLDDRLGLTATMRNARTVSALLERVRD